ncbi:MAG: AMP-binding protein [Fretibacterium sp.]|nr:AMP-binding protein [Fretibacterium sp.]
MEGLTVTTSHDNPHTLFLSGTIDTLTSPDLRSALAKVENEGQEREQLILDFSDVSYISSSGLRELLIAAKKLGEKGLLLDNVQPEVEEILKVTGFTDIFQYRTKGTARDIKIMSFKDLLEYKVQENGDRILVKSRGIEYTWRDIDRGASAIASELHSHGAGQGSHVAICGANSVNWILTFFAVQKLGAVAVLLNPQLTPEEIATISCLGDITHFCFGKTPAKDREQFSAQITTLEKSQIKAVLDIGDDVNFLEKPLREYPNVRVMSDDVCVMIFTSGSTGTPKGVLLSAFNLFNSSNYCVDNLHMTEDDKMCAILPLFHIFGLTAALLASVISGASLVLPRSVKPDELMSVISSEKCTILHSVPTVLLRLVNAPGFSTELVSSLRASYLSGAPVSESQLQMLMGKFPNNHFVRRYGLSEMTPVSATGFDDDIAHTLKTVGKPLEGTDVRIKDMETGKFCSTGVQGEIVVQGRNMMCSYYKLPVEKQPFDEEGFLHTGDLGFLDEDGYLHFTGRAKELIIRGGENIMPNEVASAISAHESIVDAKVIGVPDETYGEAVSAAVVLKAEAAFNEEEMRDFLMSKLAKYKIPTYFFVYEKLPALANGKIDAVSLKKEIIDRIAHHG